MKAGRKTVTLWLDEFIATFKPLLEPEQVLELAHGYYEGSSMLVWLDTGPVEVSVGTDYVVIEQRDYARLVEEMRRLRASARRGEKRKRS